LAATLATATSTPDGRIEYSVGCASQIDRELHRLEQDRAHLDLLTRPLD
jgi:hypothetical protein